jgi:hypothetical protein
MLHSSHIAIAPPANTRIKCAQAVSYVGARRHWHWQAVPSSPAEKKFRRFHD